MGRRDKKGLKVLGLGDFSGLNAFGADKGFAGRSVDKDPDPLQIGLEAAQGFADDLGARTAFSANQTTPFIFDPWDRTFTANFA